MCASMSLRAISDPPSRSLYSSRHVPPIQPSFMGRLAIIAAYELTGQAREFRVCKSEVGRE